MPLIIPTNSISAGGYDVANSLRFDDGSSDYLNKTFASSGNRKTFTISTWFKRSGIGTQQEIISSHNGGNDEIALRLNSTNELRFYNYQTSGTNFNLQTNQVLRDTSAWYHVVLAVDTTQATSSNRIKIYLNGEQITSFSSETYPNQNIDLNWNMNNLHFIGLRGAFTADYFDGSLAHFHNIDGTAYAASDFGETDSTTGQWKPKTSPSVTYGTNGFFLKFANSGSMGTDSSGNGNNFTVSGTLTQTQDTPANVFATWNPLHRNRAIYLSEGPGQVSLTNLNTTATGPNGTAGAGYSHTISTLGFTQGKWYAEFKLISELNAMLIALVKEGWDGGTFGTINSAGGSTFSFSNGKIEVNSTTEATVSSPSLNDIINVAVDADNQKIWYGVNGTWQGSGTQNPSTGDGGYDYSFVGDSVMFFGFSDGGATLQPVMSANFGNGYFGTTAVSSANSDDAGFGLFEYAPPTGYYSLCTKNINTYG